MNHTDTATAIRKVTGWDLDGYADARNWALPCIRVKIMGLTSEPMVCWRRSTRPAGLHDVAAAASGTGLRTGASPRVVTWFDRSPRGCFRCGLTPVLGPPSSRALIALFCRPKTRNLVDSRCSIKKG